jgi:signal transduction histidine kinase
VWTRLVFSPIQSIIDNLSSIINKREYHTIAYNKHDEFRRLFTMINDLNKSLLIQEKIRSDFLSDLSHEIKTPITAIKCYLEGIEDGVIEIDTDTVGLLRSEIDRLIRITATVMEFEKLEQQKRGSLYVERINLETIFRAIREEYSPQLLKNNQKIIFPTIKELWISFDKDKATQLVHNVFSNFTKYAGENAVLTIQHQHHKTDTEIIFSDNGIGVSSSEIPFLKEKFYRADKSRSDGDKQGIGIGLSVIEKIIQLHGGEWKIESEQ